MSEDINVTDGTVLEALNNKVDLDGGNYKGSELEAYIHEHCGNGSGFNLGDMIITDHILEGEEAIGKAMQGTYVSGTVYPDFYNKYLAEKNSATATETTLGDSTLTMYVHPNGHQFYNIADKTIVDTFYGTYGIADFYGIDEENVRIFLPRNKYFAVKGSVSVAGNGKTLGWTDGTQNFGTVNWGLLDGVGRGLCPAKNYGGTVGEAGTATALSPHNTLAGITTDPTKSGIEAKLQPNENRYLYYVVGNVVVNKADIDVSKVLDEAVLKSSLEEAHVIIETYENGTSGYRVWSDGYCEQWGRAEAGNTEDVIALLKPYFNTEYDIKVQLLYTSNTSAYMPLVANLTTMDFTIYSNTNGAKNSVKLWRTYGRIY